MNVTKSRLLCEERKRSIGKDVRHLKEEHF